MVKKILLVSAALMVMASVMIACAVPSPAAPAATASSIPATSTVMIPATPTVAEAPTATLIPATPTATSLPTATKTVPVSAGGNIAVGIVLPDTGIPIFLQDQTSFRAYLKTLGYSAQILFSQGNSAREKSNVEALIKQGIKVLILCPVGDSTAAVEEARAAGVKVIAYDRLILNTVAVDYYVSFNNVSVGQAQAQYLVDHVKGKGEPLYLYAGNPGDNNAFMFFEGAWSVLQPKIADGTFVVKNSSQAVALQNTATLTHDDESSILNQITTNWDLTTTATLVHANLAAAAPADKGDVAILAPNDATARVIADIFGADKNVKSYVITGQDADKASLQYIINGRQGMTVYKDTRIEAKDALNAALVFLTDQVPVSTSVINNGSADIPTSDSAVVVVDKSNIKSALP